jgi:hypothetical protein
LKLHDANRGFQKFIAESTNLSTLMWISSRLHLVILPPSYRFPAGLKNLYLRQVHVQIQLSIPSSLQILSVGGDAQIQRYTPNWKYFTELRSLYLRRDSYLYNPIRVQTFPDNLRLLCLDFYIEAAYESFPLTLEILQLRYWRETLNLSRFSRLQALVLRDPSPLVQSSTVPPPHLEIFIIDCEEKELPQHHWHLLAPSVDIPSLKILYISLRQSPSDGLIREFTQITSHSIVYDFENNDCAFDNRYYKSPEHFTIFLGSHRCIENKSSRRIDNELEILWAFDEFRSRWLYLSDRVFHEPPGLSTSGRTCSLTQCICPHQ